MIIKHKNLFSPQTRKGFASTRCVSEGIARMRKNVSRNPQNDINPELANGSLAL